MAEHLPSLRAAERAPCAAAQVVTLPEHRMCGDAAGRPSSAWPAQAPSRERTARDSDSAGPRVPSSSVAIFHGRPPFVALGIFSDRTRFRMVSDLLTWLTRSLLPVVFRPPSRRFQFQSQSNSGKWRSAQSEARMPLAPHIRVSSEKQLLQRLLHVLALSRRAYLGCHEDHGKPEQRVRGCEVPHDQCESQAMDAPMRQRSRLAACHDPAPLTCARERDHNGMHIPHAWRCLSVTHTCVRIRS